MAAEWRSYTSYTFCPLFPGPRDAEALELLKAGLNREAPVPVHLVSAPVQGLAFFTARGQAARGLDHWWAESVPADSLPVILVLHEADLDRRLLGLDADFVVGVPSAEELGRYAELGRNVRAVVTGDARELTEFAMQAYAVAGLNCFRLDFPYRRWWLGEAAPQPPPAYPSTPSQPSPQGGGTPPPPPPPRRREAIQMTTELVDPFEELSRLGPLPEAAAAGGGAGTHDRTERAPARAAGLRRLFGRRGVPGRLATRPPVPEELTALLTGLAPGAMITVASRKGGVGKTALAAGVAQLAGYALERAGSAAIIDQNIANPDQWGRMDVPPGCATVWDLMTAIEQGQELPAAPTWAAFSPALAVYPESRQAGEGYSWGTIESFVRQLRNRHLLSVIDLPNRLPDAGSAEASVAAAYTRLADLVVLPTDDDRNSMQGVLDYLSAESMRDKKVVVAYRVSPDRQVSGDPLVLEMMGEIQQRVVAVARVPKTEKATLAVNRGKSILEVHSGLRAAYVRIALTIARELAA